MIYDICSDKFADCMALHYLHKLINYIPHYTLGFSHRTGMYMNTAYDDASSSRICNVYSTNTEVAVDADEYEDLCSRLGYAEPSVESKATVDRFAAAFIRASEEKGPTHQFRQV